MRTVTEAWRVTKYGAVLVVYAAAGYLAAALLGSWLAFAVLMIWFLFVLIRRRRREQPVARAPRGDSA